MAISPELEALRAGKSSVTRTDRTTTVSPALAALRGNKTTETNSSGSFSQKIWSFIKNVPSMILRSPLGSTAEFLIRSGSSTSPVPLLSEKQKKSLSDFKFQLPYQDVPIISTLAPYETKQQALGGFGEAAFDIVTAFAGGSLLKTAGKEGLKAGGKAAAEEMAKSYTKKRASTIIKTVLLDAGVGAGYGTFTTLQDKNATREEILRNAFLGAGISALVPPVLGGGTKFLTKSLGKASEKIGGKMEGYAGHLEEYASRYNKAIEAIEKRNIESASPRSFTVDEAVKLPTFREKAAGTTAKTLRAAQKSGKMFDYLVTWKGKPLTVLEKRLAELGMTDVPQLSNIYRLVKDRGTNKAVKQFSEAVDKLKILFGGRTGELTPKVMEYHSLLDDANRFQNNLGLDSKAYPNGEEDLAKALLKFVKENWNDMKQLKAGVGIMNNLLDTPLRALKERGGLEEAEYKAIKQKHGIYLPWKTEDPRKDPFSSFFEFEEERPSYHQASGATKGSVDIKRAKGTERSRSNDYLNNTMEYLISMNTKAERQNLAQSFVSSVKPFAEKLGIVFKYTREMELLKRSLASRLVSLRGRIKSGFSFLNKFVKGNKELSAKIEHLEDSANELFESAKQLAGASIDKESVQKFETLVGKIETRVRKLEIASRSLSQKKMTNEKFIEELSSVQRFLKEESKSIREELKKLNKAEKATHPFDIPRGKTEVLLKNGGITERVLVPEDLGWVLKEAPPWGLDLFKKLMQSSFIKTTVTGPSTLFRNVVVNKNPLFYLIRNPIRDTTNAWTMAGTTALDAGRSLIQLMRHKDVMGKEDAVDLAREYGAFIGRLREPFETPAETAIRILNSKGILDSKKIEQTFGSKFSEKGFFGKLGDNLENMNRLAVFKKKLAEGMDPDKAAEFSRTALTDFGQYGAITEVLAGAIPFLNPRIQGFFNMANMMKNSPTEFVRRSMYVQYLALLGMAWNSKFESSDNIPWSDKLKNFTFIYREEDGRDPDGKPMKIPFYISVPVGETALPTKGFMEFLMAKEKERDILGFDNFMAEIVKNMAPIADIPLPPSIRLGIEAQANYSFYKGGPILTDWVKTKEGWKKTEELEDYQQYSEKTASELAKLIGKIIDASPQKVDYIIKQGVITDIINALDMPFLIERRTRKAEDATKSVKDETDLPFLRGILKSGEYANWYLEQAQELKEVKKKNEAKLNQ